MKKSELKELIKEVIQDEANSNWKRFSFGKATTYEKCQAWFRRVCNGNAELQQCAFDALSAAWPDDGDRPNEEDQPGIATTANFCVEVNVTGGKYRMWKLI